MKLTGTAKDTPRCLGWKRATRKLPILFLLALLISLSGCFGARSIQGKWEAEFASKRTGEAGSKAIFEFLPDGTFNVTPPGHDTIVDKDNYQLLDDGRTLKMRGQVFRGDADCKYTGDAIECETETAKIKFKRL